MGPILSKIEETQPAYVTFWNLDPTDASRFMVQFKEKFIEKGLNALVYMQYTPNIPEFLTLSGDAANGLLWTTSVNPVGPDIEAYKQRWIAKFKEDPKSTYAYTVRDAFDIWVKAVEQAGCVDCYDKIVDNIRAVSFSGNGGLYQFKPEDQQAKYGDDLLPTLWYQIQNGENVVIAPDKYKKGAPSIPPWVK